MAAKKQLMTGMIAQQLKPEYWHWSDDEKRVLDSRDAEGIGRVVLARLDRAKLAPTELYAIVHDKDVIAGADGGLDGTVETVKPVHVHIAFRFSERVTLSALAVAIGVDPQYIDTSGRGRYAFDNTLAYLTHVKYAEKHQYSPNEVATIIGRPYEEVYESRKTAWLRGRAMVNAKRANDKEAVQYQLERALAGEVTRDELLMDDDGVRMLLAHKKEFDDAFALHAERRAKIAAQKLEAGVFSTTIIFVTGKPGAGKTAYCQQNLIPSIQVEALDKHNERWDYYDGASSNVFDDWAGEEILFLDDLRAGSMDASDWLRLLDPYKVARLSARYRNKGAVAPRVIVMTAYETPHEFFSMVSKTGGRAEALDQFIRRLSLIMEIYEYDPRHNTGSMKIHNIGRRSYQYVHELGNGRVAHKSMSYGIVETMDTDSPKVSSDVVLSKIDGHCSDLNLGIPQDDFPETKAVTAGVGIAVRQESLL